MTEEWDVHCIFAGNDVIYNGEVDLTLYVTVRGDIANEPEFGPVFWSEDAARYWVRHNPGGK